MCVSRVNGCGSQRSRLEEVVAVLGLRLADGFLPVRRAALVDFRIALPLEDREERPELEPLLDVVELFALPAALLPRVRLEDLSLSLVDFRVDELFPASFLDELVELLVDPFDARFGALAPCLGIFAPERRASLYEMATAC